MKKQDEEFFDYICDDIGALLKSLKKKDKREIGILLCEFIAVHSIEEDDENFFAPVSVLDEAKKDLTQTIDRGMLDAIGERAVNYVKDKKTD